jgi:hypothetical protein
MELHQGMDEYRGGHPVPWGRKEGASEAPLCGAVERWKQWELGIILVIYYTCMGLK